MVDFKKLGFKVLDLVKAHKFITIYIALILCICVINGIRYQYNKVKYGWFEQLGSAENVLTSASLYEIMNDVQYDENVSLKKGDIIYFISNKFIPNRNNRRDFFGRIGDFLIHEKREAGDTVFEIYDKSNEAVLFKIAQGGFLYKLDETKKELIPLQKTNRFDNINAKPVIKEIEIGDKYQITLNKKSGKKEIVNNMPGICKVYKLDNENLLLGTCYPYTNSLRFNTKEEKLYRIDASEISYDSRSKAWLIQLPHNKFLNVMKNHGTGEFIGAKLYKLVDDKFVLEKNLEVKNHEKYAFSPAFPLVLDENKVLFIGKFWGVYGTAYNQCFLYDIKKDEIIRINNFPELFLSLEYRRDTMDILKASNNKFYIASEIGDHEKRTHYIYKYRKGNK